MRPAATLAFGVFLFTLGVVREASAYCRSTTCRTSSKRECATDDNGCVTDGVKLFWPTSCVGFSLNRYGTQDLDPEEAFAVIRKTFQAWAEVPCPRGGSASITFEERGPVSCKRSEYNKQGRNLNVVLFQDDDWKYRGVDATLAKTSVSYNDETGEIYDADIEINAANNTLTLTDPPDAVEYDLQAILTHEVGHFIGIAHSSDGSAVMSATYEPGSIAQRTLTDDDVAAVCAAYPPANGVACNVEPRGGFSESCDAEPTSGVCSMSSLPPEGESFATSFAVLGIGLAFAVRRAHRSFSLGRAS